MARKSETAALNEHQKENRNAVIAGLLLALLPFVLFIILFLWAWSQPEPAKNLENCRCNDGSYHCCMAEVNGRLVCNFDILAFYILQHLYGLIYLPLGVLLYLASMLGLSDGTKSKLRFAGKSFFVGGIIGIVLAMLAPILVNTFMMMTVSAVC